MTQGPVEVEPAQIPQIVDGLRKHYNSGVTRPLEWRKAQLKGLIKILSEHEREWVTAMKEDMGSHMFEAGLLIENVKSEITHTLKKLDGWMKPKKMSNPWSLYPGGTKVIPEPYGVVCDFVPYNYPMFLGFSTLLPILAAGNVCLFKPSSNTPACARLYQQLFPRYLDKDGVKVVCGPSSICPAILECKFDFIFYTGSPAIGKSVMEAASKHLTPVILELGGKAPVYVDQSLNMDRCCKRLVWGKMFNGGQTCVCPDYVLVHEKSAAKFKESVLKMINQLYGDVKNKYNDNITHIINRRHFDRITRSIETCGGNILLEGLRDPERLYIGPTVIENPALDSQMMTEEIFGPVLPIITVRSKEEAIEFINARERPLALYILTDSSKVVDEFTQKTSSGAILQNDVMFHVSSADCPFGGIGNSGMGQYHGRTGFKALSHMKPVVVHSTWMEIDSKFPPYTEEHLKFIRKFA